MSRTDKVTFLASYPAIQSAIKIDGAGNGARIQLDIPETELYKFIKAAGWRQSVLKVTIELVEEEKGDSYGL
jgi:hypothetical protein